MKIVMIVHNWFMDAVWMDPRVYKEAKSLTQAGHEVVVLCSGKEGEKLASSETRDGVAVIRRATPLHWLYNSWSGYASYVKARQYGELTKAGFGQSLIHFLLKLRHNLNYLMFCAAILLPAIRQRADVYIAHDFDTLHLAYIAARLNRARLVYNSHELWTERVRGRPYLSWQKSWVAWQEKSLVRRCDLVVTMSNSVAKILSERYAIPEPLVIRNIPPFAETTPSPEIRALLTRGDLDKRVVIYVGFLDYGKGLFQLINAAEYLDGITIALLGDGVLRPMLEERITDKGLTDKVHLVGWMPRAKVLDYVASADVGVSPIERKWPNYYHNLDNKLFDYIMAGIPLAVSDHPEKRALVEQYDIGVTFDERDPRDIAHAIQSLLTDPARYEQMRANCLKAAREELNWEMESKKYVSAIETLIRQRQTDHENRLSHR